MDIVKNIYVNISDIVIVIISLTYCIGATVRGFIKENCSIISWIV